MKPKGLASQIIFIRKMIKKNYVSWNAMKETFNDFKSKVIKTAVEESTDSSSKLVKEYVKKQSKILWDRTVSHSQKQSENVYNQLSTKIDETN